MASGHDTENKATQLVFGIIEIGTAPTDIWRKQFCFWNFIGLKAAVNA
jgi:hypothetical protein